MLGKTGQSSAVGSRLIAGLASRLTDRLASGFMTKKNTLSPRTHRTLAAAIEPLEARRFFDAVSVGVDPAQTFQTIDGMGAAMIPWETRPEYNDPAFFDKIVNDLGATMARASLLPMAEVKNDNNDPNSFNWAGFDASAVGRPFAFFKAMQDRGVNKFLSTVWTAPNWMKTNRIFTDGGTLRPDMYGEYAEYLSAVSQLAKSSYGVNLSAISVQNEPYFVEPYESTTYDKNQLREAVRAIGRKFKNDGVTTKLIVPEDLNFEDRIGWYVSGLMNDPETKNYIGGFAGHALTTHWPEVRDLLAPYGKPYWMTETSGNSNTWEGAMGMANGIVNALGLGNSSAYLYWQFSEKAGNEKFALMSEGKETPKYHAAKQFYRYIRPGMVHVGATSSLEDTLRALSFKDPKTGAMTHVILNRAGSAHDVTFNLSGAGLPGSYKVFQSSATQQFASLGNIAGGSGFSITVPGMSITTITSMPELTPKTPGTAVPTTAKVVKTHDYVTSNSFFRNSLKGYDDSLAIQVANGADVNQVAPDGQTPLIAAAGSVHGGSITTLQRLLFNGANVNAKDNLGRTALHAAAATTFEKYGAPHTIEVDKIAALLNAGADVNAKDNDGRTALIWASMVGNLFNKYTQDTTIVDLLLSRGADPNIRGNDGRNALDWANLMGYDRIADKLVAAMGSDTTKPTADVVDVTPDPRAASVHEVAIKFSERIQGFDLADVVLTRNGATIGWNTGVTLSTTDDITFKVVGLGGYTAAAGNYVLSIKGSGTGITDISGNALAAGANDAWTNGTNPPPPPPPGQTPFKGTPFAVSKSVAATIQAEDFDNGGEGVAFHDLDAVNSGGAYRTTGVDVQATTDTGGGFNVAYVKAGEWLEYTINVVDAGAYTFGFRAASTGSNAKFHAEIDGANVTGAMTVPNTGGFQKFQTVSKTGVNLTAGKHILRLAFDAAGTNGSVGNFNHITIGQQTTPPPPPPPPAQTPFKTFNIGATAATIQAEDFDNGGQGVAYHDLTAGNTGGAYRTNVGPDIELTGDIGGGHHVGYTAPGEWLEYTINVATTGTYRFDFRVSSKGLGGKFKALVNGADKTGALQVPDTKAWNTFGTVTKTGVALSAGKHVLRLQFDSAGASGFAGNFNWIKVTKP